MPSAENFDLSYRPVSYWNHSGPVEAILSNVKGELRRKMIRDLLASGEPIEEDLLGETLSPEIRSQLERVSWEWSGGEYLPDHARGEVEIARLVTASVGRDVVSIRARVAGGRHRYRVVCEWQDTNWDWAPKSSRAPLTMGQLVSLIDKLSCDGEGPPDYPASEWWWQRENGADEDEIRTWLTVSSSFYPELGSYYYARAEIWIAEWKEEQPWAEMEEESGTREVIAEEPDLTEDRFEALARSLCVKPASLNALAREPEHFAAQDFAGARERQMAVIDDVAKCGLAAIPLLLLVDHSTFDVGRPRPLPEHIQRVVDAILATGPEAISILVRELGDRKVASSAARVLERAGSEAVAIIAQAVTALWTNDWWQDDKAREEGCFIAVGLLRKLGAEPASALKFLSPLVFEDRLPSLAGRAADSLDAHVDAGDLTVAQLSGALLRALEQRGDPLPRLILSDTGETERLEWARSAMKRLDDVTWKHRLVVAARAGMLDNLSEVTEQLVGTLLIPDHLKPTCYAQTMGARPHYHGAMRLFQTSQEILLSCARLPEPVLLRMDEAFAREKYPSLRVKVAQHPSASRQVWCAALRRNPDPLLVAAISDIPDASRDDEIAALLTGK